MEKPRREVRPLEAEEWREGESSPELRLEKPGEERDGVAESTKGQSFHTSSQMEDPLG